MWQQISEITSIAIYAGNEHYCVNSRNFGYVRDDLFNETTDRIVLIYSGGLTLTFVKQELGVWRNHNHIYSSGSLSYFIETNVYDHLRRK